MEPPIVQLVRYGQVNETLEILDGEVYNRRIFLDRTGAYLQQFIGLAARNGSVEILQRCAKYGVKVNVGSKYGLHAIVGAASRGHDHVIQWILERWVKSGRLIDGIQHYDKLKLPQSWLYPSLHKAIQGQHVSTVKLLVEEAWADVNACDKDNLRPLHAAADPVDKDDPEQMSRYEKIVDILVTAGARVNDIHPLTHTMPLYEAVSRDSRGATKKIIDGGAEVRIRMTERKITVLHVAAAAGFHETLRAILEHERLRDMDPYSFDIPDEIKRTPLHAAIYGGHQECVRILIKKGLSLTAETVAEVTAIKAIFTELPHPVNFLTEILDEQVSASDNFDNKVVLDFRLLISKHTHGHEPGLPDVDVVIALINAAPNIEQMIILQHPLLETFLHLKYLSAMPYDVSVLLLHLLFVYLLWGQVTVFDSVEKDGHGLKNLFILLLAFAIGFENIGRLIVRLIVNLDKLQTSLAYASVSVLTMVIYFEGIVAQETLNAPTISYYFPEAVYLSSIMVLCSWINLMWILIRFPIMGEYSFVFVAVLIKVGKVLVSFTCLVIGFALSISLLFSNNDRLNTPWKALARTLVLMTGEYEHDALFSLNDQNNSTVNNSTSFENNNSLLQVPGTIIFTIFVMVTSITLMNLMVGLAVNDIQELLKEGRTRRLMKQAESTALSACFPYSTSRISRKMELNSKSSSWIPYFRIPANVRKALYELALKNANRDERSQTGSASGTEDHSLAEIKLIQKKMAKDLNRLSAQVEQMMEDRNVEKPQSSVSPNHSLASQNIFPRHSQERNAILAIDYEVK